MTTSATLLIRDVADEAGGRRRHLRAEDGGGQQRDRSSQGDESNDVQIVVKATRRSPQQARVMVA